MKGFLGKKSIFIKLFTVSLSISIIGSWGAFYWLTNSISDVNLSLEGLNTCFSRVAQNYSGKMIGSNQSYTSSNFYQMTEECFSELENVMNGSFFIKMNKDLQNNFKDLVKKSYWFHRDTAVESEFTSVKDGKISSITKNYKEIESIYEQVTKNASDIRTQLDERKKWVFSLGLLSVLAIALTTIFGTAGRSINENVISAVEDVSESITPRSFAEERQFRFSMM